MSLKSKKPSKADEIKQGLQEHADAKVRADDPPLTFESDDQTGTISGSIRREKAPQVDEVMAECGADPKVWYVKNCQIRQWRMGYVSDLVRRRIDKHKTSEKRTASSVPLWGIAIKLERIVKKCLSDGMELLFKSLHTLPRITTKPRRKPCDRLFVPCLFDTHLGKYAWGLETGTDQDTDIQRNVFRNAMEDLIELSGGNANRILFPIGNDFFQVNNWLNTTAKGTAVDHDGRFPKVFDAGCQEVISAINKLLEVAPVEVVWVPGNHDPETSYALAMVAEARFHGHKYVNVDRGPNPRKYFTYGQTLLGLTHGNEEKMQDLPNLMAQERPQEWARTTTREWLLAHMHHSRKFTTKDTLERMGVVMRTVRALSGTDSWHNAKGYVGSHRAAEAYIYGKESGYMGHWSVAARG